MKEFLPVLVACFVTLALACQLHAESKGAPAEVLTGLDVLKRDNFAPLKGKNIASSPTTPAATATATTSSTCSSRPRA